MSNGNDAVVQVDALVKHFKSGPAIVAAVDDVSFKLPRGKMMVIKGSSGSGKTTLLNLIGALDRPTAGKIVVDGINVSGIRGRGEARYRLTKVGFVFQSYYLIPNLTAQENVMLPMDLVGVKRGEQEIRALKLLQRVGIDSGRAGRRPTRLSGGEQQRVAIARALSNDPAVILADEPTGNLDSKTGRKIVDLLNSLTRSGKTVIVATHSGDIAAEADLLLEMVDGKIITVKSCN